MQGYGDKQSIELGVKPLPMEEVDAKLQQLARLLSMPVADLNKKIEDEDKTFVWLKRQVDEPVAQEIAALGIKGVYQRKEYKRKYPEGEAAAHVVGFTNVENIGQEGVELAFDKEMTGERFRKQVLTILGDNLSMNPVPQLVKPIMDVYANKDSFSGRPIETMGMDKLKSEYRFTDRTSMTARAASTGISSLRWRSGATWATGLVSR